MGLVFPEYGTLFWMLVIFGISLYILKRFAWKPILKALENREESITNALAAADKAREEIKGLKDEHEQLLAQARKEKEQLLREAREIKEQIIRDAKNMASEEGQKIIATAKQQIEAEKKSAINEMKQEIAGLSVLVAEKIIRKDLGAKQDQEDLINDLLKDLKIQR